MKKIHPPRESNRGRRAALLVSLGILFSSSAGADEEPHPVVEPGSLAVSHQLPRRIICRTGPGLQFTLDGQLLSLTGFVTEKNITAKSYKDLKPGSCAGMEHPSNNVGTAKAPVYTKFGPQKNGPMHVRMGATQQIAFELTGRQLTALKAVPSGPTKDTEDYEDKLLATLRAWVQARDGEIEFSANHDAHPTASPESFVIFANASDPLIARSLVK